MSELWTLRTGGRHLIKTGILKGMDTNIAPVLGFESYYSVTEGGDVISSRTGRIMKPSTNRQGYKRVILYQPGRPPKTRTVHSLVLEAFEGARPEGAVIRHLNGTPGDNRRVNLAWGTASENMHDRELHGSDHNRNKVRCPLGHLLVEPNIRLEKARNGWRSCKACHQARSDQFNGTSLGLGECADMRYFMVMTGRSFRHGTRRAGEREMYETAKKWLSSQ